MKNTKTVSFITAGLLSLGVMAAHDVWAEEYIPDIKAMTLVNEDAPGIMGHTVIIKKFELPPGNVGDRHTHPGPVYVYIEEGELTIDVDGQARQTFKAGSLYEEPLGQVMQASNLSTTMPTKLVVFQIGEKGKPMMMKAK